MLTKNITQTGMCNAAHGLKWTLLAENGLFCNEMWSLVCLWTILHTVRRYDNILNEKISSQNFNLLGCVIIFDYKIT